MDYNLEILEEGCRECNISLSQEQTQQFIRYYELLVEWNKVMNLTGITQWEEVLLKHFVDSLAITKIVDMTKVHTLMDVGTGAGFPGLPVKIAFPHVKVTLLDSLNKRINFLNQVIEDLQLKDIMTIHGRAEDMARKAEYRDRYDISVSRAVSRLSTLTEYCLPYVRTGGSFVSYKSGSFEQELQEAAKVVHILGGKQGDVVTFSLLDSDISRSLVRVDKVQGTPKKYPRKAGLPVKEPII